MVTGWHRNNNREQGATGPQFLRETLITHTSLGEAKHIQS